MAAGNIVRIVPLSKRRIAGRPVPDVHQAGAVAAVHPERVLDRVVRRVLVVFNSTRTVSAVMIADRARSVYPNLDRSRERIEERAAILLAAGWAEQAIKRVMRPRPPRPRVDTRAESEAWLRSRYRL